MLDGLWRFTEEKYPPHLDSLRQFVAEYDYDSLFAK